MRAAQGHAHDRRQDAIELGAGQGVRERLLRYFHRRRLKALGALGEPREGALAGRAPRARTTQAGP